MIPMKARARMPTIPALTGVRVFAIFGVSIRGIFSFFLPRKSNEFYR
jgi:hypothetical protein